MQAKFLFAGLLLMICAVAAAAQKTKPWTEWSEKEADKVLNDSGWAQTQSEGDSAPQSTSSSAITATTTARREDSNIAAASRVESGEKKDSPSVHYRVRLLSAKPIRAAIIRKIELQGAPAERVAQMRAFVDRDFSDYIVVTISIEGDKRRAAPSIQELMTNDPEAFKTVAYLERKDGKRVTLMEYRAPIQDNLGAKFVFPRKLEGKPFIDTDSGEMHFVTQLGKNTKINRRFKVSEMTFEGKLEY